VSFLKIFYFIVKRYLKVLCVIWREAAENHECCVHRNSWSNNNHRVRLTKNDSYYCDEETAVFAWNFLSALSPFLFYLIGLDWPKVKKRKKKEELMVLRLAKTWPSISIRLYNATKSTEPNQRSRDERKVQLAFNFRLRLSPLDHSQLYCLVTSYTVRCRSAV